MYTYSSFGVLFFNTNQHNNISITIFPSNIDVNDSLTIEKNIDVSDMEEEDFNHAGQFNLKFEQWFKKHRPSRNCVQDLVSILREEGVSKTKPQDLDTYLRQFQEEMAHSTEYGLEIGGLTYTINIRATICDAPAKAFITGVPSHTSRCGCAKCTQVGKKINGTLTYSSICDVIISDEDFASRKYTNFHQTKYLSRNSPLESIGVKMVTQVILDVMHLIDLGVVRKFLIRLINNKIFGENSISYNVHSLLHLEKSINIVGDPTSGSSYPFENYLQKLKKYIKSPRNILEQIYRK
ncbi:uncharacterized protein LOC131804454 [Musca domestica]|uniref:Uncharacterized protein LOC131804454 n=1 Tax=Musca domestica TaxID=7370 RepID=A0ABM3VC21_MUSDO|nr:uncharacterized protein LOC131804454 [Musca domestica]